MKRVGEWMIVLLVGLAFAIAVAVGLFSLAGWMIDFLFYSLLRLIEI